MDISCFKKPFPVINTQKCRINVNIVKEMTHAIKGPRPGTQHSTKKKWKNFTIQVRVEYPISDQIIDGEVDIQTRIEVARGKGDHFNRSSQMLKWAMNNNNLIYFREEIGVYCSINGIDRSI